MDVGSLNGEGLKELALRSLTEAFGGPPVAVTEKEKDDYSSTFGAFVTLKINGELRGCIGRLDQTTPLWRKIPELARASAFEDNRFPPMHEDEMAGLSVEVTILDEQVEVGGLSEIVIGRDGLIVEKGFHRGLLLPQVAVEHGWDVETFLSHTCLKAGLTANDWKTGGIKVYKFEGVVF